eukprot:4895058-Karenia_brevis.AAC.1
MPDAVVKELRQTPGLLGIQECIYRTPLLRGSEYATQASLHKKFAKLEDSLRSGAMKSIRQFCKAELIG